MASKRADSFDAARDAEPGVGLVFFFIRTTDKAGHLAQREALEHEHRGWLDRQGSAIIAAGAILRDDGSDAGGGVYLIEADNRAAAEAFIHADPFFKSGLFAHVEIARWRKAYVDGKNLLSQQPDTGTMAQHAAS